jgi:hypothetical protein
MDLTKIDNVKIEDIDFNDAPDFVDAFIASADYNGVPMTEEELDELNDNEDEFKYECLMKHLY